MTCTGFNVYNNISNLNQEDEDDENTDQNSNEVIQQTTKKLRSDLTRNDQSIYEEFSKSTLIEENNSNKLIIFQDNSVFDGSSDLNQTGI